MSKKKLDPDEKRIGKKIWTFWSGSYSRRQAEIIANRARKQGFNARIIKSKNKNKTYYEIYARTPKRCRHHFVKVNFRGKTSIVCIGCGERHPDTVKWNKKLLS